MDNKFVNKVLENKDIITIFYSEWCSYSMNAINLLKEKNVNFKGYLIDKIDKGQGVKYLAEKFLENKELEYDENHLTRPIIFVNGKFLGGYTELVKYLQDM